jgi:hypothetical protein
VHSERFILYLNVHTVEELTTLAYCKMMEAKKEDDEHEVTILSLVCGEIDRLCEVLGSSSSSNKMQRPYALKQFQTSTIPKIKRLPLALDDHEYASESSPGRKMWACLFDIHIPFPDDRTQTQQEQEQQRRKHNKGEGGSGSESTTTASASCSSSSLVGTLMKVLSSSSESESTRERAISCLTDLFQAVIAIVRSGVPASASALALSSSSAFRDYFAVQFYIQYSHVIQRRFRSNDDARPAAKSSVLPMPTSTTIAIQNSADELPTTSEPEPVEEIRLQMVELVESVLDYWIRQRSSNQANLAAQQININDSSSRIASILYGGHALLDPFSELKQCCCRVVQKLCRVSPHIIPKHALQLIKPLTFDVTTEGVSSNSRQRSLLRHRHAKTRSAAVQATVSIIEAMAAVQEQEQKSSEKSRTTTFNTTRISKDLLVAAQYSTQQSTTAAAALALASLEITTEERINDEEIDTTTAAATTSTTSTLTPTYMLETFVLPCWLECSMLDRSGSVRKSIIDASRILVGVLAISRRQAQATASNNKLEQDTRSSKVVAEEVFPPLMLQLMFLQCADVAETNQVLAHNVLEDAADNNTRIFCQQCIRVVVPLLTNYNSHWPSQQRLGYLNTLCEMIKRATTSTSIIGIGIDEHDEDNNHNPSTVDGDVDESRICEFVVDAKSLEQILSILETAAGDSHHDDSSSDVEVHRALERCTITIGQASQMRVQCLTVLLDRLENVNGTPLSTSQKSTLLLLSAYIVKGSLLSQQEAQEVEANNTDNVKSWLGVDSQMQIMTRFVDLLSSNTLILNHFACREVMDHVALLMRELSPLFAATACNETTTSTTTTNPRADLVVTKYLRCCIQLLGSRDESVSNMVGQGIILHRMCDNRQEQKSKLMSVHFRPLLRMLERETETTGTDNHGSGSITAKNNDKIVPPLWDEESPQLSAFDALLRYAGSEVVLQHLDVVAPVFQRHLGAKTKRVDAPTNERSLSPDGDDSKVVEVSHSIKLSMLALLETSLSNANASATAAVSRNSNSESTVAAIQPFAQSMVETVILPNLVWQAGGAALGIRKVSLPVCFPCSNVAERTSWSQGQTTTISISKSKSTTTTGSLG